MGAQGGRRLSGVGRGASVSLTADRRKQMSGMDAALSASGPPPIGGPGAAVGCELFVWLDRPITTAVATAPRQAYGSTLNSRLQTHGSEGRAETTLGGNREPNRGIGHWLAFGSQ